MSEHEEATESRSDESLDERLRAFSLDETTPDDALALMAEARERCPVAHSEDLNGFHMVLGYDEVTEAAGDWERFSSEPSVVRPIMERGKFAPLEYDPPEHTSWRKVFQPGLNKKTPERVEPLLREDIEEILEEIAPRGECDLIADYADKVPLLGMCHALGFDSSYAPRIREMAVAAIAGFSDPDGGKEAFGKIAEFAVGEVKKRRDDPQDDYLTFLATAEIDGEPITEEAMAGAVGGIALAGHESTVAGLGSLLYYVLKDPETRDQIIADPSLASVAAEEALRLRPPFFGFFRRATEDTSIDGVEIGQEDDVFLCWAAANRDPETFEDPDTMRLDLERPRHLTFGRGKHACMGAPLARLELRLALTMLLERLPDITLAAPDADHELAGGLSQQLNTLPATYTAS